MKIQRIFASLLLFASGLALAQTSITRTISTQNLAGTGDCTALSCAVIDMASKGGASVQVAGTYTVSGGLLLQRSNTGVAWETVSSNAFIPVSGTGTATITSGSVGTWQVGACVGFRWCRVAAGGAVTGSATVEIFTTVASVGGSTSVSGGAGDASAANQVTGNNSLSSIDTKTPALGQALAAGSTPVVLPALQNAVATQGSTTSGQSGAMVQGAVTTAAPTYTTGQTSPLSLDTSGQLRITGTVSAGGVAQGSTTSGQTGNLIQGAVTTASPSYTTAQTSPLSLDTSGNLRVNVVTGGAGGGNVTGGTAHDAVGTGVNPVLVGGYASAAAPTDVSADGDATRIWLLRNGAQAVNQTFGGTLATGGAGAVTAGTQRVTQASDSPLVTATGAAADSVCGTDTGTCSLIALTKKVAANVAASNTQLPTALGQSTMANSLTTALASNQSAVSLWGHGATAAAVPANVTAMGARAGANSVNVAQGSATVAVNVSTATTTQLVALSGSTQIYVTGLAVVAGGTGNITLVYGTGSSCGTGTTSLSGAIPLIANAGFTLGSGLGAVLVVPAGQALCITTSAAVQMSGFVTYTQF